MGRGFGHRQNTSFGALLSSSNATAAIIHRGGGSEPAQPMLMNSMAFFLESVPIVMAVSR